MKKIMIFLLVTIMLLGLANAAESPYLTATVMKYEPTPAAPGNYATIYVKLQNKGTQTAKNVVLEAVPEFPFSVPNSDTTEEIGMLPAQSFHVATFKVLVDESAVQGENDFKVRYNINEKRTSWATQSLTINVQTLDAILSINEVLTTPAEIVPGETGEIKLVLENLADSLLTDISVKLDLSGDDMPFAPVNSASEKSSYQIKPGETEEFNFQVRAYPDTASSIYKLPVTITYYDNVGTEYKKEDVLGIIVNSEPDIKVLIDSTSLMQDKKTGSIVLKIVNRGLTDVKLMSLRIEETENFEVVSPTKEEYIGNVDSDDFDTVEFDLLLKDSENLQIPLELEYRDNNNKLYTESLNLNLEVHSAEQLGQNGGSVWPIIIALIVIAGGIYFWRRRKKKKSQK